MHTIIYTSMLKCIHPCASVCAYAVDRLSGCKIITMPIWSGQNISNFAGHCRPFRKPSFESHDGRAIINPILGTIFTFPSQYMYLILLFSVSFSPGSGVTLDRTSPSFHYFKLVLSFCPQLPS